MFIYGFENKKLIDTALFIQLGTTFNISKELLREGEQAICTIYVHEQQHNVSEMRYCPFGSLNTCFLNIQQVLKYKVPGKFGKFANFTLIGCLMTSLE